MARRSISLLLCFALLSASAPTLRAQTPTPSEQGARDGRTAAQKANVGDTFAPGFAAGAFTLIFAPEFAKKVGPAPLPQAINLTLTNAPAGYRDAYLSAWRETTTERRQRQFKAGAAVGFAAAIGAAFLYIVMHAPNDCTRPGC